MHIVLINHLYPPAAQGGAETVVYRRAQTLVKAGHTVSVITSRPKTSRSASVQEKAVEEGVAVYRIYPGNITSYDDLGNHGSLYRAFWFLGSLFGYRGVHKIKKILQEIKPDLVETHNILGLGLRIPRMIQKGKYNHRVVLHDVQLVEPSGILSWNHIHDTMLHTVYAALMRRRFGTPDTVETPSLFLQEFYRRRGFFPKSQWQVVRPRALATTPVKQAQGHFLFVGSLVFHKGLRTLMQAWEMYSNTKATLHIVGKGPMQEELTAWAKEQGNVEVVGPLYGQALMNEYQKADTLLFPSICLENYPTVIGEARDAGLYIIASDTGGTKETFVKGNEGILIEPGNVEVWVKALTKRW